MNASPRGQHELFTSLLSQKHELLTKEACKQAHLTPCGPLPEKPRASMRQATMSAAKPGAIRPMSSRPRFLALPSVASLIESAAPIAADMCHLSVQGVSQFLTALTLFAK